MVTTACYTPNGQVFSFFCPAHLINKIFKLKIGKHFRMFVTPRLNSKAIFCVRKQGAFVGSVPIRESASPIMHQVCR